MNHMAKEIGIWEIAVLALLREAPMHPYQMQRLLSLRHKDEILALKRGSLYHAIGRLLQAGLIAIEMTDRDGNRPERTTYRLTPAGLEELKVTIRKIVATPRRESSEFMAAMSFLVHLDPKEAAHHLKERAYSLDAEIAQRTAGLAAASVHVQRINLIESEYLLEMLKAERAWTSRLEKDIGEGKITWNLKAVLRDAAAGRKEASKVKRGTKS
jgi:DNA-binding PadR family transcriptional regulator